MDVELFAAFCIQAGRIRDKPDKADSRDFVTLRQLGSIFGMGPAERTRLTTPEQPEVKKVAAAMR
jgi:hypothetical protein